MSKIERQLILGALDSIALALVDHQHVWTEGERAVFEQAVYILTNYHLESEWTDDTEDDGDKWKKE